MVLQKESSAPVTPPGEVVAKPTPTPTGGPSIPAETERLPRWIDAGLETGWQAGRDLCLFSWTTPSASGGPSLYHVRIVKHPENAVVLDLKTGMEKLVWTADEPGEYLLAIGLIDPEGGAASPSLERRFRVD
jgi:hypothetical protein